TLTLFSSSSLFITSDSPHPSLYTPLSLASFFFSTATSPTEIYTLSLHDALPIFPQFSLPNHLPPSISSMKEVDAFADALRNAWRSEEHTSELQSRFDLVCRLLLEKKKKKLFKYKVMYYCYYFIVIHNDYNKIVV